MQSGPSSQTHRHAQKAQAQELRTVPNLILMQGRRQVRYTAYPSLEAAQRAHKRTRIPHDSYEISNEGFQPELDVLEEGKC